MAVPSESVNPNDHRTSRIRTAYPEEFGTKVTTACAGGDVVEGCVTEIGIERHRARKRSGLRPIDLASERPAFPAGSALRCLFLASRLGLRRFFGQTLLAKPGGLGGIGFQLLPAIGGDLRGKPVRRAPAFLQYLGACRLCRIPVKHGYSSIRSGVPWML
jgi:hypothetical protein